jgi:hypothetical protein
MRMAYLILAHDGEAQLDALLCRLLPPGSPDIAIVHADRRSDLWRSLRTAPAGDRERVRLIADPVAVRWGHWSQVAAILRLIEAALDAGCDYAHLISGADWPVVAREDMAVALSTTPLCHIEASVGLQEERMQGYRLDARWLQLDRARNRLAYAATWELRRVSRWIERLSQPRSRPWGSWHKGSTWWSLPAEVLQLLAHELPPLIASGRLTGTLCADEHVIPTIVAAHFPDRLAENRRFIVWPEGHSSPRLLVAADQSAMLVSGAWFARKVSLGHDPFFLALTRDN